MKYAVFYNEDIGYGDYESGKELFNNKKELKERLFEMALEGVYTIYEVVQIENNRVKGEYHHGASPQIISALLEKSPITKQELHEKTGRHILHIETAVELLEWYGIIKTNGEQVMMVGTKLPQTSKELRRPE